MKSLQLWRPLTRLRVLWGPEATLAPLGCTLGLERCLSGHRSWRGTSPAITMPPQAAVPPRTPDPHPPWCLGLETGVGILRMT